MAKQKTHKALTSRIKITGTGKVLKRYAGQDHFNSRDSGKVTRKKRTDKVMSKAHRRALKNIIPNL